MVSRLSIPSSLYTTLILWSGVMCVNIYFCTPENFCWTKILPRSVYINSYILILLLLLYIPEGCPVEWAWQQSCSLRPRPPAKTWLWSTPGDLPLQCNAASQSSCRRNDPSSCLMIPWYPQHHGLEGEREGGRGLEIRFDKPVHYMYIHLQQFLYQLHV